MDDLHELDEFIADLTTAPARAGLQIVQVLGDTGRQVQQEARALAPGAHGGQARLYPSTITYEVHVGPHELGVEIGPEARGQGNLGPIFEFGTAETAPEAHMWPATDRAIPDFEARLQHIGGTLL